MGTGSYAASPRGQQEDVFCNRFEAVAAGLGTLGRGGFVLAPGYGSRMRYVALVTDAELTPDAVLNPSSLRRACDGCRACLEACGVKAHKAEEATVTIGGHVMMFQRLDVNRCDWSKRYALSAASGFGYLGSTLDLPAPSVVTAENLAAALAQFDKVLKLRPCGIEMCAIRCPA
jgi:ferredoxin